MFFVAAYKDHSNQEYDSGFKYNSTPEAVVVIDTDTDTYIKHLQQP